MRTPHVLPRLLPSKPDLRVGKIPRGGVLIELLMHVCGVAAACTWCLPCALSLIHLFFHSQNTLELDGHCRGL
jgi:hypothetical protein